MKFIAILTAVPFESEQILACLKNAKKIRIVNKTAYQGKLSGARAVIMHTGLGKVNAAHSATGIIGAFPIKHMINTGIGGAYPHSGLKTGDIAVALKETYCDEGVISSRGWESLREIGIPLLQSGRKKYFNEFPLDKHFVRRALRSARLTARSNVPVRAGTGAFVTVSASTGTHSRAVELEKRFNAVCENMEGAAIAHVCVIHKIPLLEIRGISNIAGVRDKRKWDIRTASENCQQAVLKIIQSM